MRKYFNFSSHVSRRVTCQKSMETFQKESCVRGYHIYRELWDAVVGEELECQREHGNATDMNAVAVIKDSTIAWADIEDVSGPLGSGRQSTGFIYCSRAIFSNSS